VRLRMWDCESVLPAVHNAVVGVVLLLRHVLKSSTHRSRGADITRCLFCLQKPGCTWTASFYLTAKQLTKVNTHDLLVFTAEVLKLSLFQLTDYSYNLLVGMQLGLLLPFGPCTEGRQ